MVRVFAAVFLSTSVMLGGCSESSTPPVSASNGDSSGVVSDGKELSLEPITLWTVDRKIDVMDDSETITIVLENDDGVIVLRNGYDS